MDMQDSANGRKGLTHRGILSRIARDKKGNTLAIVGAALVPLTAMIGSGVDMSRAYMAKQRLQSACDAAALAGRRVMTNDQMSDTVRDEARAYFNFNFAPGAYQTTSFTPDVSRSAPGTIRVSAATTIPTSIMRLFGYTSLPLSVTCDASLNYVNTDVLLVLDVTGSMSTALDGSTRIVALRDAVMALYDQLAPIQAQLEAAGLRLRYGIVPYSSTVNVGELLRDANVNNLAEEAEYSTISANYNTPVYVPQPGTPEPAVEQIYNRTISRSDCDKYGQNIDFSGFTASPTTGGGPAPNPTWSRSFENNESAGVDWGWPGAAVTSGTNRTCRRRYVEVDTTYTTEYRFTNFDYRTESIDISPFRTGNTARVAVDFNGTVATPGRRDLFELARDGIGVSTGTTTWNGCIIERDTVNTITTTSPVGVGDIPANAFDLNINLVPTNDDTRWRPMLPDITFRRTAGSTTSTSGAMASSYCPVGARRLNAWTRGNLLSYVNSLQPVGSTYHDIGMIWGARMISNAGVFADSPDVFNNMPVARHIIFMTDGAMDTDNGINAFQGIERNDKRVSGMSSPSETELNGRHMQRFRMACNAAKNNNTSIWVIAFAGTTVSGPMLECASNPNQASTATNRQQLIDRFAEIGQNIGALRLTQ